MLNLTANLTVGKQGGPAVLRPATQPMTAPAGAAAILSNYMAPGPRSQMVRPATPSTPPVTRSGSPVVSVSVPSSQDQHRLARVMIQRIFKP